MMSPPDHQRGKQFKVGFDQKDSRQRRDDARFALRKSKKEEQLMKRRYQEGTSQMMTPAGLGSDNYIYTEKDIPKLFEMVTFVPSHDHNEDIILVAVTGFRKILSVEKDPPVDAVLATGVLPHFVAYLSNEENPMLVFQAAWALTNISSTDRAKDIMESGAVPKLIDLLRHTRPEIREQAAWCLGNLAADCLQLRNCVLSCGAIEGLVLNLKERERISLLNTATWAVSNLCRGKPSPSLDEILPVIQPLADFVYIEMSNISLDVIVDAVWALSYLTDGDEERIQKVMDMYVTPQLIDFMGNNVPDSLMTPTVRCLGNFAAGSEAQTQDVIDFGILKHVLIVLDNPCKNIRKEICWLLSNISAGTHQQIEHLFREPKLLEKVISLAIDSSWEVQREAIWVIVNIFSSGSDGQVRALVQLEGLQAVVSALGVSDTEVVIFALEAIERVLLVSQKENLNFINLLEEYHGVFVIESLQEHPNDEIYGKSSFILESFFGVEEEECENIKPTTVENGKQYGFGISSKQPSPLQSEEDDTATSNLKINFGGGTKAN